MTQEMRSYRIAKAVQANERNARLINELPGQTAAVRRQCEGLVREIAAVEANIRSLQSRSESLRKQFLGTCAAINSYTYPTLLAAWWMERADRTTLHMRQEARDFITSLMELQYLGAAAERKLSTDVLRAAAQLDEFADVAPEAYRLLAHGCPSPLIRQFRRARRQASNGDGISPPSPLPADKVRPVSSAELGYRSDELRSKHLNRAAAGAAAYARGRR